MSDRNQFDVRVVPPVRGRLFDRKMRLVAGNAESFELRITPLYADNLQETLKNRSENAKFALHGGPFPMGRRPRGQLPVLSVVAPLVFPSVGPS